MTQAPIDMLCSGCSCGCCHMPFQELLLQASSPALSASLHPALRAYCCRDLCGQVCILQRQAELWHRCSAVCQPCRQFLVIFKGLHKLLSQPLLGSSLTNARLITCCVTQWLLVVFSGCSIMHVYAVANTLKWMAAFLQASRVFAVQEMATTAASEHGMLAAQHA